MPYHDLSRHLAHLLTNEPTGPQTWDHLFATVEHADGPLRRTVRLDHWNVDPRTGHGTIDPPATMALYAARGN